jgi:hypothetical protein
MELSLKRQIFTDKSTIGSLYVDGKFVCYCLEDMDRGINKHMVLAELHKRKVYGKTAIPTGRYQVLITQSARFKRLLPFIMNVPGFEGIRIHPGNSDIDTHGCLLPGNKYSKDYVSESRLAFDKLYQLIKTGLSKGNVFITIER